MRLDAGKMRLAPPPALPMPYPRLAQAGLKFRPGQTSLTVAAPGVGKSLFWLNVAQRAGVPTMYWSADTDQYETTVRTIALWTGYTTEQIAGWLLSDTRQQLFDQLAGRGHHVDWVFDTHIKGPAVRDRMDAFAEKHGEYPGLVVLDNMSNAIENPENEYAEIKQVQTKAQEIAREAGAHIAILHHAKGIYDDGNKPIPQSGGMQNPFKIPEVGVTLYRPSGDSQLGVCVVKNRGGKADPAAKHPINLQVNLDQASVLGWQ